LIGTPKKKKLNFPFDLSSLAGDAAAFEPATERELTRNIKVFLRKYFWTVINRFSSTVESTTEGGKNTVVRFNDNIRNTF